MSAPATGLFQQIGLAPPPARVTVLTEPPEPNPMAERNFENRTLFHSDNLPILRAMNSESVDLIATDPPFNKSRDFHATPDSLAAGASFQDRWSWERDVHEDWTDQITDDLPKLMEAIESARYAHSDGMGAFMCFMAVRLLEMRRVLKSTGSIYLHCDPTASHYLKAVMDAIFGWKNFKSEIIWQRTNAKGLAFKGYPNNADFLLYYSNGVGFTWNRAFRPHDPAYIKKFYRYVETETGRRYQLADLANPNPNRPNLTYEFLGITRVWRWTRKRMQEAYEQGVVVQQRTGAVRRLKRYLDEMKGNPIDTIWDDIRAVQAQSKERTGYPTQKPLLLYERIIKASSNEGDTILDPFAGCATTLVAAEKLHRQWVGIDIWDNAREVVLKRLESEGLITDSTDKLHGHLFPSDVITKDAPPIRTDNAVTASPNLRTKVVMYEPPGQKMTRAAMYKYLVEQHGTKCQGCDRTFDDQRYLQLDHNTPRADGGLNHISNRVLLCGPCNQLKSHVYTLSGLRRENKKRGFMSDEN